MKSISEQETFCRCSRRLPTSGKAIIAAAIAAMMLLSLTACGEVPPTGNSDQAPSAAGNAGGTVEIIPSTDRDSSPDVPANEDSAGCEDEEITWGSNPVEPVEAIMQAAGLRG